MKFGKTLGLIIGLIVLTVGCVNSAAEDGTSKDMQAPYRYVDTEYHVVCYAYTLKSLACVNY